MDRKRTDKNYQDKHINIDAEISVNGNCLNNTPENICQWKVTAITIR